MAFSFFSMAVETFAPMLNTLSQLLDKAAAQKSAETSEGFALVDARLAPDMYPLSLQVQIACAQARTGMALLMGQTAPPREEITATLDGLKERIRTTVDFLHALPASALDGAEDRQIQLPLQAELVLELQGHEFLRDWIIPQFYFHVVTAYDILRHHGVELGKRDYMAHVGRFIHQRRG